MTALTIEPQPVPLRQDEEGALRVGNSRVLLELVYSAWLEGAPPEAIVQRYDTLKLADVYSVISYCLTHEAEVGEYLRRRDEEARQVRQQIEATQSARPQFREELRKRYVGGVRLNSSLSRIARTPRK